MPPLAASADAALKNTDDIVSVCIAYNSNDWTVSVSTFCLLLGPVTRTHPNLGAGLYASSREYSSIIPVQSPIRMHPVVNNYRCDRFVRYEGVMTMVGIVIVAVMMFLRYVILIILLR